MPTVMKRFESKSRPGAFHEVRLSNDREDVYCTCPAWRFSKASPKCCKHIVAYFASKGMKVAA